ncbi:class I SAM-dependent methyltransferase [Sphaerisporangium sp. NPDC049002]|uniref:class I SAM-dependent methyltransferase n=1 Tax=unclassified Sphaerisporangium TaxID=2630420 RepID=UPI0033F8815F
MTVSSNPFLDATAQGELYGHASRLAARTSALHRAKKRGRPVADVIAVLAAVHLPVGRPALVTDLGCGRGTSSRVLAEGLRPRRLVGIDVSAAMLKAARIRFGAERGTDSAVSFVQADFHHLPLPTGACALAVAAFCLYHAMRPEVVIAEIARVLAPDGVTILVTKSADSYHELDALVAAAGLDPDAPCRESLYAAAHSANLANLTEPVLSIEHLEHEVHGFTFTDYDHVAEYLATSPKYHLPAALRGDPAAIAAALRRRLPDTPVSATSVITYLLARQPGGRR